MTRAAAAAVLAILAAAPGQPQRIAAPPLFTFHSEVDDSEQPYALYVPRSLAPGKKYPLIISLHDEDSTHAMNLQHILGTETRLGQPDAAAYPDLLVAAPFARGTMGYRGIAERDVYDVLADVERRFPVDEDRVYLTGISMGGGGALRLALTRPDVWAAVAAVSPVAVPGSDEFAGNALNLPVRLFHGDADPVVPVQLSRAWQRRFLDAGVAADYIEYPGMRHNAWMAAYRNQGVFQWLEKFRRNPYPERVRLGTRSYRYSSAYWLRIDGLTPGTAASVDARWHGPNALAVETHEIDGFTIRPETPGPAPIEATIDGTVVRVKRTAEVSFIKVPAGWRRGVYTPAGKRPGGEGPIAEAVSGPQIYVYGTGGAPTAEELESRRKVAESAANWPTGRQRLTLTFPVKPDSSVTAEDLDRADLILFGTPQSNSLIARFAPRMPLALSPAAPDYGLLFVTSLGKHYALVSSGLPWWTGADEANRGGDPLEPPRYRLLTTFGDYMIFKGSLGNVIAEGRFDRNWKLPADAAARIAAAGTVTIR